MYQTTRKDVISGMPRKIIARILELMPIRDAVRTSILSREWRYHWAKLSSLVFDDQFFTSSMKNDSEYVRIIDQVLLVHDSPIFKFILCVPSSGFAEIAPISQWVLLLSRKCTKDFTLNNTNARSFPHYKLPSHLFSCVEMTHLRLYNCSFNPPPEFKGFPNLVSLNLCSVTFAAGKFDSFISNCPLLEILTLVCCVGHHVCIRAPNLKCVVLDECYVKTMSLISTESLKTLSISFRSSVITGLEHNETRNMINVLGCLPRIEKLCVGDYALKFLAAGGIPGKLPATLDNLKSLVLSHVDFNDISCALCLIRSSPNLQELEISAIRCLNAAIEPVVNFCEEDSCEDNSLSRLRTVKFFFVMGLRTELELIKFLLARSSLLETMFIEHSREIDADAVLMIANKLIQFHRASPKAEIVFNKSIRSDPIFLLESW